MCHGQGCKLWKAAKGGVDGKPIGVDVTEDERKLFECNATCICQSLVAGDTRWCVCEVRVFKAQAQVSLDAEPVGRRICTLEPDNQSFECRIRILSPEHAARGDVSGTTGCAGFGGEAICCDRPGDGGSISATTALVRAELRRARLNEN